jgi:hypothetical protein
MWHDPAGCFRMANRFDRVTATPPPIASQHVEFDLGFSCRFPARREYGRAFRLLGRRRSPIEKHRRMGTFCRLNQIKPLPYNFSCTQGTKKLC